MKYPELPYIYFFFVTIKWQTGHDIVFYIHYIEIIRIIKEQSFPFPRNIGFHQPRNSTAAPPVAKDWTRKIGQEKQLKVLCRWISFLLIILTAVNTQFSFSMLSKPSKAFLFCIKSVVKIQRNSGLIFHYRWSCQIQKHKRLVVQVIKLDFGVKSQHLCFVCKDVN